MKLVQVIQILAMTTLFMMGSAFAKSSHSKKKHHHHYSKSCKHPYDGLELYWNSEKDKWYPSHYDCGKHGLADGVNDGDIRVWNSHEAKWVDENADSNKTIDGNLIVNGFIQSLYEGIIFPDGSVQSTAAVNGAKGEKGDPGEPGLQGPAGEKGMDGAEGPEGPQGPAGANGAQGLVGPQGPQGPQGPAGADGAQGLTGPQGPAGADGAQGLTGPQGPAGADGAQGLTGPQGPAGADGAQGLTGPQGPAGAQGLAGPQGPAGAQGLAGPQGPAGADGAQGLTGPQGPAGVQGLTGLQGEQGPKGDKGDPAVVDVGTGPGQIPQLDDQGKLPSSILPAAQASGGGSNLSIAYLKDVKPSGTSGGACTSGSWLTRTLNITEGDTSFIVLNPDNSFTLQAGNYHITGVAPAFVTNQHQAKLFDITGGTDVIVGSTGFSHNTSPSLTTSTIMGVVNLTSAVTFSVQHRCAASHPLGFGLAGGFGSNEVYTQVKITKLD